MIFYGENHDVAKGYLSADRDQQFLLPPDVREWLPEQDLAWFVLDVVAQVDRGAFHATRRTGGVGRAGFDPDTLLPLLVYPYCLRQRSSRAIERLCERDTGYRVIAANRTPEHCTIARFRAEHADAIKRLFTHVLVLCAAAGLVRLDTVAIDGTKMAANAGLSANRTREAVAGEVERMLAEAAAVDAEQDAFCSVRPAATSCRRS